MKPIQIFVVVAALAVAATAQNTSSTSPASGSKAPANGRAGQKQKSAATPAGAQTGGVKLIVPKNTVHANTAGGKNSSAVLSPGTPKMGPNTASAKNSAAGRANSNGPGSAGKSQTTGRAGAPQKPPVMVVKPVKGKSAVVATAAKKTDGKDAREEEKNQVKIVQKTVAAAKAPDDNTVTISASGRRDPFLSIIRSMPTSASGPNCSTGKRCLFIPELELKGIAKDTEGQMMAVVVSNTRRAYFLRENDQVFNGSVQKINSDSVIFREFAIDHLGRETAHEVVKRIPKS